MRLKSKTIVVILLVVIFGGIALATQLGMWNTVSSKEPALITSGDKAGLPNPADIRGSYTFNDVTKAFGVPVEVLGKAFRVPEGTDVATFQVKGLEALFEAEAAAGTEVGAASVRLFVAFYTGLPIDTTTDTYLPAEAVEILKNKASLTPEQVQYLDTHIAGSASAPAATEVPAAPAAVEATPVPASGATPAVSNTDNAAESRLVTGKTTFQMLLDWGVSKDAIETAIKDTMPAPNGTIKDYYAAKGLEFSEYKTALQAEVDRIK